MQPDLNDLEKFIECFFELNINLNDVFHFAGGDSYSIASYNLAYILPIYRKYEFDALVAYVAIARGYDPDIPQHITTNFKKAKKEIELIQDKFYYEDDEDD